MAINSPLTGIPNLPSPAAAYPQLNPWVQMAQAAGQYPAQIEQARAQKEAEAQNKLKTQQQQSELETAGLQRKVAENKLETDTMGMGIQKLGLYYKTLVGDPNRAVDPGMISDVKKAASEAKIGSLTTRNEQGVEVVDINALNHAVNMKLPSEWSDQQKQRFEEADPEQRKGLAGEYGTPWDAIPESTRNMQPILSQTAQTNVTNQMRLEFDKFGEGHTSAAELLGWINTNKSKLLSAHTSTEDIINDLKDPSSEIRQSLGRLTKEQIFKYQQMGIDATALAAYRKKKTEELPLELAEKIRTHKANETIKQEGVDVRRGELNLKLNKWTDQQKLIESQIKGIESNITSRKGLDAYRAAQTLNTQIKSFSASQKNIIDLMKGYLNAGEDIPKEVQDAYDKTLGPTNSMVQQFAATHNFQLLGDGTIQLPSASSFAAGVVGTVMGKQTFGDNPQRKPEAGLRIGDVHTDANGTKAKYIGGPKNDPNSWVIVQ